MGNGEAEELICMTHGYELKRGECWKRGVQGGEGERGEKNGATVMCNQ